MTDLIVATKAGRVSGSVAGDVARFLGIPYAAPPAGSLRFAAPAPAVPWDGVRDASGPGANAPHASRAVPGLDLSPLTGCGWRPGDDYLTMDIWTPAPVSGGLPVMLFIHGGGFVGGTGSAPAYDGSSFARQGIVCITINYRLGVEGFLPLAGGATNIGLRDQLAALRWVQDNVAAFGGDPANVTLFGQSAGAAAIVHLMSSPLAVGLFRRAIVQSGHAGFVRPVADAAPLVTRIAETLGVEASAEQFRTRSAEQILAAQAAVLTPGSGLDLRGPDGHDRAYSLARFVPVYGDDILPVAPESAIAAGAGAKVDVLVGTNTQELNLYFVPTGLIDSATAEVAIAVVGASIPDAAEILRAHGLESGERSPGEAMTSAMTDLAFRKPARAFAAMHRGRTHYYEFGWRSPAYDGRLGACHGVELPFVFNTLETAGGPDGLLRDESPRELAAKVHALWAGFAKGASVNWPEYSAGEWLIHRLDTGVTEPDILGAPEPGEA